MAALINTIKRGNDAMQTIGLIGGMSWESTVTYYQIINREIQEKIGGFHSAKCVLYSVDFYEIERCQSTGNWDEGAAILSDAAQRLEKAGADFIVICTNTMHKVSDKIAKAVSIPVLHIADTTAAELKENRITKAALLGTRYTMEQDFYKARLTAAGIDVIIPNECDRFFINDTIYNELCLGVVSDQSKQKFLHIINKLENMGARGVILGCTEIGLLIKQNDTLVKLFDTAVIHAKAAARLSIDGS